MAQLGWQRDTVLELLIRLTEGSEGVPAARAVVDRLTRLVPRARRETMDGVGHVPQLTAPGRFVETTVLGLRQASA